MENEKRFVIRPHIDIELGVERGDLEYFLTFPDSGMNYDTGLIFFISGFGSKADSEYERVKLRPYLADKYNCVTVGINYFGIGNRLNTGAVSKIDENFIRGIYNVYGIRPESYFINNQFSMTLFLESLEKKGIKKVDDKCVADLCIANNEYQSFGFLPAIDHLQVLGEILKTYNLNSRSITAFGTSYGGYIALLLGKFAPNTFSVIIDNSGFTGADMRFIAGKEIYMPEIVISHGKERRHAHLERHDQFS